MSAPSTPSVKVVFDYKKQSSLTPLAMSLTPLAMSSGDDSSGGDRRCPFDKDIHVMTPQPSDSQREAIEQLKLMFKASPQTCKDTNGNTITLWNTYDESGSKRPFLCESTLMRFLIARNFSVDKAYEMLIGAIKWRRSRDMDNCIKSYATDADAFRALIVNEGLTGKIYLPGRDKYGRQVVIFDNSIQNTRDVANQLVYLGWNLELATLIMATTHHHQPEEATTTHSHGPQADKYVIFMHLEAFSFFNCPPWAAVRETVQVLCSSFPERLGHCVCYQGPGMFTTVFNTVKALIDPRTRNKVIFLNGDVSEGSANDKLMKMVIGDNWKKLTGAEEAVLAPKCSPGFDPVTYWPYITSILEKCFALSEVRVRVREAHARDSPTDGSAGDDEGSISPSSLNCARIATINSNSTDVKGDEEVHRIESEVDRDYYEYRSDYRGRAEALINAPYVCALVASYAIVVVLAVLLGETLHGVWGRDSL